MDWIEPMEPILIPEVKTDEGWAHQVKWDGIRGLCYVSGGRQRIFTKRGRERTGYYPELSELPKLLGNKDAILDGEIIIPDETGKPSFYLSLIRERVSDQSRVPFYAKRYPVMYVIFDMMFYDGKSLAGLPLKERSILLREKLKPSSNIVATDDFTDGKALFQLMKQKNWEGIVSKRLQSSYVPGKKHRDWYKTKLYKKLLAVVCGTGMKEGAPNSLVLGVDRGNGMEYIGKASVGLTQEHFRIISANTAQLRQEERPFGEYNPEFKNVLWLLPVLTCWVSFLEWTNDGSLRHPKILGFSTLKPEEANGREYAE